MCQYNCHILILFRCKGDMRMFQINDFIKRPIVSCYYRVFSGWLFIIQTPVLVSDLYEGNGDSNSL